MGSHPNIVALKDVFETEREWLIVMELVTGGDPLNTQHQPAAPHEHQPAASRARAATPCTCRRALRAAPQPSPSPSPSPEPKPSPEQASSSSASCSKGPTRRRRPLHSCGRSAQRSATFTLRRVEGVAAQHGTLTVPEYQAHPPLPAIRGRAPPLLPPALTGRLPSRPQAGERSALVRRRREPSGQDL